jgi:hypothetical protein
MCFNYVKYGCSPVSFAKVGALTAGVRYLFVYFRMSVVCCRIIQDKKGGGLSNSFIFTRIN